MRLESRDTVDPRVGYARSWRVGPLVIEWYAEKPPQSWLRFEANLNVRMYDEDDRGGGE